jgi:hypothetical protein
MLNKLKLLLLKLRYWVTGPSSKEDALLVALLTQPTPNIILDKGDLILLDAIVSDFITNQKVDWDKIDIKESSNPKLYSLVELFKGEVVDDARYFLSIDFLYQRYPELVTIDDAPHL